jgi:hypothetical protein
VWFHNFERVHTVTVTTGTVQGCASSLWFYVCGTTLPNLRFRNHIVQAADDVYIIREAQEKIEEVIQEYKKIDQHLDGEKMRIICSTKNKITKIQKILQRRPKIVIETGPTKVLGAILHPDRKKDCDESTSPVIQNLLEKLQRKYEKIPQLPVSLQVKWLILLNITMHGIYYIEASSVALKKIASFIDDLQLKIFQELFDIPEITPSLHVQFFYPIEDGGMGLFPYSDFALHHRERMLRVAEPFLQLLHLERKETYDVPITEGMTYWEA